MAASALAGYITTPDKIPENPSTFITTVKAKSVTGKVTVHKDEKPRSSFLEGRIWIIQKDNIDTDLIFHNRYLAITELKEMGQYTFDNLKGYEDFARKVQPGDLVIAGKNFGCGSSRQQAVDCFISLGISGIIAESFGAIYERNAINAAFPIIICKSISELEAAAGDKIRIDLKTGEMIDLRNNQTTLAEPFSEVQFEIYMNGSLLG